MAYLLRELPTRAAKPCCMNLALMLLIFFFFEMDFAATYVGAGEVTSIYMVILIYLSHGVLGFWGDRKSTRLNSSH